MSGGLVYQIKAIQRAVGATPDGIFGPQSARLTLATLAKSGDVSPDTGAEIDERTRKNIDTLDPAARETFRAFAAVAKATAATYGCDYIAISGNRTWAEQDALYARGRTAPGDIVTNARGGRSNHNFGIALDFGVFRGKVYLDESDPRLAATVHTAVAGHAEEFGLEWGGSWKSFTDPPHFEIATGLSMAAKRTRYQRGGSVLS